MSGIAYGVLNLRRSGLVRTSPKFAARRVEDQERSEALVATVALFAVGLEGSPDLKAAEEVTNLGTVHHEIHFTVQEGLDAIRDVMHHIETYGREAHRACLPEYLMSRKIKRDGHQMNSPAKVPMRCLAATCTSIKRRTPRGYEETVRSYRALLYV